MRVGITGLRSAGKTTIFNVLSRGKGAPGPRKSPRLPDIVAAFSVSDLRLAFFASSFTPEKATDATVEFADVWAGGMEYTVRYADTMELRHHA